MSTQEVFFHVPACLAFSSYSSLVPIVLWLHGQRMVARNMTYLSRGPRGARNQRNETKRMFVEKDVKNLSSTNRIRYTNDIFLYNGLLVFRFFYKL